VEQPVEYPVPPQGYRGMGCGGACLLPGKKTGTLPPPPAAPTAPQPTCSHPWRQQKPNRCIESLRLHYLRDLLTKVAKTSQPWAATLVRTIFDQPGAAEVAAQFGRVATALEAKLPAAAAHLKPGQALIARRSPAGISAVRIREGLARSRARCTRRYLSATPLASRIAGWLRWRGE